MLTVHESDSCIKAGEKVIPAPEAGMVTGVKVLSGQRSPSNNRIKMR